MIKKLTVMAFITALTIGSTLSPALASPVKLTYSNFFPPTHIQSQLAAEWCQEVEKRTNGQVVVDYFPGGTLTSAKQCYDGVVDYMSDIGMSALAYSRGRFPVMAAVDLPLGYSTGLAATQVANAVFNEFKPKELSDTHVLFFHAHGPGLLHTAETPVTSTEDMKGLKVRATGNSAKVVSALGGTPVAMSMPDSYQSIRKGIVNGGMYPIETNKGWRMAEVVDFCTDTHAVSYTTTFFVTMNKDKWSEIPADAQKIITELSVEFAERHGRAWDESDAEGRAYFLEQGNEIVTLEQSEATKWKEAMQPIIDEYVADADKKRINGREVVDFAVQKLAETIE
ncbi:MAG TPA: TRAP transporter substrate-binding protein [Desulfomicrobiaceae bacterium]|nr:TRAP transporter substrate-binding protein [Desulfomicrobiaceae bacterium]